MSSTNAAFDRVEKHPLCWSAPAQTTPVQCEGGPPLMPCPAHVRDPLPCSLHCMTIYSAVILTYNTVYSMRDIFNICGAYYNGPGTERPSGSFAAAGSHWLPTLIIPKRFLRKRTLCCGGVAHAIVVVVFVVYVMWWRRRA